MFPGQFNHEDQNEGLELVWELHVIYAWLSLNVKFQMIQKLLHSQGITKRTQNMTMIEPKNNISPQQDM